MNEEKLNNNQSIDEDIDTNGVGNGDELNQNQELKNNQFEEKVTTGESEFDNSFKNQKESGNNENSNYFDKNFSSSLYGGEFSGYNKNYSDNFPINGGNFNNEQLYDKSHLKRGLGIASMVLGILSIICCCSGIFSLIFSVLAIIFATIRMRIKSDGYSIAGLVTGILGLLMSLIIIGVLVVEIASYEYSNGVEFIIKSIVSLIK